MTVNEAADVLRISTASVMRLPSDMSSWMSGTGKDVVAQRLLDRWQEDRR